jgi:cytoskeletal protein RodZ
MLVNLGDLMDNYEYVPPKQADRRTLILRLIGVVVAAIAIVALIYFLVWFIFFRDPDTSKTTSKKNGSESSQSASGSNSASDNDSDTSSGSSDDQDTSTSSSSDAKADEDANKSDSTTSGTGSKDSNGAKDLSETGPGDVVAIFLATVVIAAVLRRLQLQSR